MCGCEPGFVCSRCAGTPDDPRLEHEPEPNDALTESERLDRILQTEWKKP